MKLSRKAGRRLTALWAIVCLGLVLGGCATDPTLPPPPQDPPGPITPPLGETLHTGDSVTVTFITGTEFSKMEDHKENIKEDGTITLHLIGAVQAKGKTTGELQKDIHDKYVPAFYKRLTIIVKTDSRYYSVGGEVRRPDRFVWLNGITLLSAIQSAGDFTDYAKRTAVQINRADGQKIKVNYKKLIKDPTKDLPIYPGDVIHVPKSIW